MPLQPQEIHRMVSFFPVIVGRLANGLHTGWLAPILKLSEDPTYEVTFTQDERSWIASLDMLTSLCGAVCCALTIDKIGRKNMLFVCSIVFTLGWIFIRFSKAVCMIYVARMLFGIKVGMSLTTSMIIVNEMSPPSQRGAYACALMVFHNAGVVFESVLVTYLSYNTVASANLAVGILYVLSVNAMKETVQFLLLQGRHEEAERIHRWFFSDDLNEVRVMQRNIEKDTESSLSLTEFFHTPVFYKLLLIVMMTVVLLFSTGILVIGVFASIAFSSAEFMSANEFTISYNMIFLVSSFASFFYIDRFDRRPVLLIALAASLLLHSTTSVLYFIQENVTSIPYFPWLIFIPIVTYAAIGAGILQPITTAVRSESFPLRIMPFGIAFSTLAGSLTNFFISHFFLNITATFGIAFNFLFFSCTSVLSFAFVYSFLPETRNRTSLQIQRNVESRGSSKTTT